MCQMLTSLLVTNAPDLEGISEDTNQAMYKVTRTISYTIRRGQLFGLIQKGCKREPSRPPNTHP